ncbi:hypothetical protein CHU98_g418 [Xylaria longipes]|nr:hypothetical protein CHU98_g418 [Xylaria longipes]
MDSEMYNAHQPLADVDQWVTSLNHGWTVEIEQLLSPSVKAASRVQRGIIIDDNLPTTAKMSMFRAKKLDIGSFVNIKVIRDHTKRKVFAEHEPERQALRYIVRNTTLPPRTRAEAQLQLTQMHCYTRPTQIRGRCLLGGKGRECKL